MPDDNNIQFDPHKHHTVLYPPVQTDLFTIIKNNTGTLAWIAGGLIGFATLVTAWERKAARSEVKELRGQVLKLEKELVMMKAEIRYKLRSERRRK